MNGLNFSSTLNSINDISVTTSCLDMSSVLPMPSEKVFNKKEKKGNLTYCSKLKFDDHNFIRSLVIIISLVT